MCIYKLHQCIAKFPNCNSAYTSSTYATPHLCTFHICKFHLCKFHLCKFHLCKFLHMQAPPSLFMLRLKILYICEAPPMHALLYAPFTCAPSTYAPFTCAPSTYAPFTCAPSTYAPFTCAPSTYAMWHNIQPMTDNISKLYTVASKHRVNLKQSASTPCLPSFPRRRLATCSWSVSIRTWMNASNPSDEHSSNHSSSLEFRLNDDTSDSRWLAVSMLMIRGRTALKLTMKNALQSIDLNSTARFSSMTRHVRVQRAQGCIVKTSKILLP